jgi:hypothetical protein
LLRPSSSITWINRNQFVSHEELKQVCTWIKLNSMFKNCKDDGKLKPTTGSHICTLFCKYDIEIHLIDPPHPHSNGKF